MDCPECGSGHTYIYIDYVGAWDQFEAGERDALGRLPLRLVQHHSGIQQGAKMLACTSCSYNKPLQGPVTYY